LLHVALAVLLLFAQAHATSHWVAHGVAPSKQTLASDACDECALFASFGSGVLPTLPALPADALHHAAVPTPQIASAAARPLLRFRSRAPPSQA
jgi:hypothetical protein